MYRYSHITPTANAWASNLNNRWNMIALINDDKSNEVLEKLTTFFTQTPSYEPPVNSEDKTFDTDYDFPPWSRAASPLIKADADYFTHAVMSIRQECTDITPIAKVLPDLTELHNYVNIDLRAPDDILINAIKRYIGHARNEINIEGFTKQISATNFSSWQRVLLLPYLDLKIWLRASGLTLIKREVSQILYRHGHGYKRGDSTIKLAKRLFGEDLRCRTDFLETLTAQGIHEVDENRAVHELLNRGMSARRIADKLKITTNAVDMHKKYKI